MWGGEGVVGSAGVEVCFVIQGGKRVEVKARSERMGEQVEKVEGGALLLIITTDKWGKGWWLDSEVSRVSCKGCVTAGRRGTVATYARV